jgi:hypothetical protein
VRRGDMPCEAGQAKIQTARSFMGTQPWENMGKITEQP